jgi:hypothetical protein
VNGTRSAVQWSACGQKSIRSDPSLDRLEGHNVGPRRIGTRRLTVNTDLDRGVDHIRSVYKQQTDVGGRTNFKVYSNRRNYDIPHDEQTLRVLNM